MPITRAHATLVRVPPTVWATPDMAISHRVAFRGLDAQLIAEDQHEGYPFSYIQKHWDDMYLGLRCPEPVFMNPTFKLADDADASKTHLRRAAEFTTSFVKWSRKLLDGTFEPDLVGKGPATQCSSSFQLMFASSKTPQYVLPRAPSPPLTRLLTAVTPARAGRAATSSSSTPSRAPSPS